MPPLPGPVDAERRKLMEQIDRKVSGEMQGVKADIAGLKERDKQLRDVIKDVARGLREFTTVVRHYFKRTAPDKAHYLMENLINHQRMMDITSQGPFVDQEPNQSRG